ncbi:MAG: DUF4422 domain-containing protein [Pseudomonadota bacterium]
MKTTLYLAYHQAAPHIAGSMMTPIHVGRAKAAKPLRGMIGDDTGDNISDRNRGFCELTALYWAWKNDTTSDYVGLMHYRRVLDVTDRAQGASVEVRPHQFDIAKWVSEAEDWLASNLGGYEIILPRPHRMGRTVEGNYSSGHLRQDFDLVRRIIAHDHPDYLEAFDGVAAGRDVRLGNMAIFARPVMERYCSWLFGILEKVSATDLDRSAYTAYQTRYLGFLAERLLTVFIARHGDELRLKEVSIFNLSEALVVPSVSADMRGAEDSVVIALAADRTYLPHAAAMIRSVLDQADPNRAYDFVLLYSGIGTRGLEMLREVTNSHPNGQLIAVDVQGAFEDSYRSSSRAPSNATYNRFLLFTLLQGFERVLYLDADVIALRDVAVIFDTDMGDAELAGVTDWIMTRTLGGPVPTVEPDVPDLRAYHLSHLGLSEAQIAGYVNAGVLLLNFAAMPDPAARGAELMREATEGRYLFRDQDILNMVFKDSLHQLDPRWNVFNTGQGAYGKVPDAGRRAAFAAKAEPWLIHYADRDYKPWDHAAVPLAQHYWSALIRTPFYGEVINSGTHDDATTRRRRAGLVAFGYNISERVPVLRGPLLRLYANWKRLTGR